MEVVSNCFVPMLIHQISVSELLINKEDYSLASVPSIEICLLDLLSMLG